MSRRVLAPLFALIIAASLVAGPPSVPAQAADATYPCPIGFVQIEDQGWWQDAAGEAWPGRHVHQQMCWPTGIVDGPISIPVRILLHSQPAGAELTRVRITDGSGAVLWSQTEFETSLDAGGNLIANVVVAFNASSLSTGIHEMRLATVVDQPSGAQQFVSSGHPLYVRSMTGGATSRNYHEARGWYTGFEYDNARTRTPLSAFRQIAQPFTFDTECAAPSGAPVTGCAVFSDPDAHNGFPGNPILPFVSGPSRRNATVDGLAPGLHKLVIKTDATGNRDGQDGTNSGLLVITVLVPGATPTPTPTVAPTPQPTLLPSPSPSC